MLALVARGWTNGRVAHTLSISERTVRKHLENINDKLGTVNRAAAVSRWARGLDGPHTAVLVSSRSPGRSATCRCSRWRSDCCCP